MASEQEELAAASEKSLVTIRPKASHGEVNWATGALPAMAPWGKQWGADIGHWTDLDNVGVLGPDPGRQHPPIAPSKGNHGTFLRTVCRG